MRRILVFIIGLLFISDANCQDAHFSQFYTLPYVLNPGLTGAINGTYRISANYRDQWSGALESPYSSFALGGDVNFLVGSGASATNDQFGVGLLFLSDRVNTIHLNTNEISLFTAYHKSLNSDGTQLLGLGIKFGVVQKNINYDNLVFGDSFNQIDGYTLPSGEILPPNNFGYIDLGVGLNFRSEIAGGNNLFAGLGINHLTQPNVSFYSRIFNPNPDLVLENKLSFRYVAHAGLDMGIDDFFDLQPRVIFQTQAEHQEINFGANLKYNFLDFDRSIYFGLWSRVVKNESGYGLESLIPLVGIQTGSFILGLSYDINLTQFSDGFNAFELSLRFIGEHDNDSAFCPEF